MSENQKPLPQAPSAEPEQKPLPLHPEQQYQQHQQQHQQQQQEPLIQTPTAPPQAGHTPPPPPPLQCNLPYHPPPSPVGMVPQGSPHPSYGQPLSTPQQGVGNYPPPFLVQGYAPPQGYQQPMPIGYYQPPPPQTYPYNLQETQRGFDPQQPAGYPPQQQPFGAPPQPVFANPYNWNNNISRSPPSEGYVVGQEAVGYDPTQDAEVIRKAFSGLTVDSEALFFILPYLSPLQLESIRNSIRINYSIEIADLIEKKVPGSSKYGFRAIITGPRDFDAWLLNHAMDGPGTKTHYLELVLLGRKNADIEAIKQAYLEKYKKHLVDVVRKELSGSHEALFMNALDARRADETLPIDENAISNDVKSLYAAMVGKAEDFKVSEIIITRTDEQLGKIIEGYEKAYKKPLAEVIKKKFGGGIRDGLIYIIQGIQNRALRDAKLLEGTMKGIGTRDQELAYRIARLHWEKDHLRDVKEAYQAEYPKRGSLVKRVGGETSGSHEKLLVALLEVV